MRIRPGEPSDHGTIERIARASFDRVYAFFALRGVRRADVLLVAESDEGRVLGFLEGNVFSRPPAVGYVYFVATDPGSRGTGIARSLVLEALRAFGGRGATRAFAAVPEGNDASMALFASLGFRRIPRRTFWRWYGARAFLLEMRMMIAPHEVLLARSFADPSPELPQEAFLP